MNSKKIKDKEIGIFSMARISSKRCAGKMTREFGDSTLTDIILSKLAKLGQNTFFAGYEPIFKKKSIRHKVQFIQRTKESSLSSGPHLEVMNFLKNQNYKYFLFISGCVPNLKIKTITNFIEICKKEKKPAFAVFEKQNYFMNANNKPLNFSFRNLQLDTSKVKKLKEFANIMYFFEKKYFLKHGEYWNWKTVRYVTLHHGIETIDIDSE